MLKVVHWLVLWLCTILFHLYHIDPQYILFVKHKSISDLFPNTRVTWQGSRSVSLTRLKEPCHAGCRANNSEPLFTPLHHVPAGWKADPSFKGVGRQAVDWSGTGINYELIARDMCHDWWYNNGIGQLIIILTFDSITTFWQRLYNYIRYAK